MTTKKYQCYHCRRPIPVDVVASCRKGGVPVRCPCRPGAIGWSPLGDGETIAVLAPEPPK